MLTTLITTGRIVAAPFAGYLGHLQARLDSVLAQAEPGAEGQKKEGLPTWAIVLIVVVILLCLVPFCIIVILTLLGPAIGNVFSNVIEGI